MKTAAGRPERRLKGRNATQAAPRASASGSTMSLWSLSATACAANTAHETAASVAARPSMLSSRLKAFVIPTSQTRPISVASDVRVDDLDGQPAREHDPRCGELGRELHPRAERVEVVREPGQEEERAACEDSEQLRRRLDRTHGDGEQHARHEAGEDADAAEEWGRAPVPALPCRFGDEPVAEVGAQERPDDESRDGQGRERDDRAHERKA